MANAAAAQILHGVSAHKTHAPLSSGDTIAICQHLHGLSNDAFRQLEDLRSEMKVKEELISKVSNDVSTTFASLQDLRDKVDTMDKKLEVVGREAGDGLALGRKLNALCSTNREDIEHLREGQKVTNTNVKSLREDLQDRTTDIKGLRADVDNVLKKHLSLLEEKLNNGLLNLRQVSGEHDKTRKDLLATKDNLSGLSGNVKAMSEEFERIKVARGQDSDKLADAIATLEDTKSNLEVTNAVIMRLNESREETLEDVAKLKDRLHTADARLDGLQGDHNKMAKSLSSTRADVAGAVAAIEQNKNGLRKAMGDVGSLQQAHSQSTSNVDHLSSEVVRLQNLADSTRHHLEVTNSMVLPNLNTGDGAQSGFQSGSDVARNFGSSAFGKQPVPQQTPRKRREATWVTRNIGAVPDRMSWI